MLSLFLLSLPRQQKVLGFQTGTPTTRSTQKEWLHVDQRPTLSVRHLRDPDRVSTRKAMNCSNNIGLRESALYQSVTIQDEDTTKIQNIVVQDSVLPSSSTAPIALSTLAAPSASVPTTMSDALRLFFLSGDFGPTVILLMLLGITHWRVQLATTTALSSMDVAFFCASVVFWWFQEYFLHSKVLHSKVDWIGKDIHQGHHNKEYYHVSVDPAILLVGWMTIAHFLLFRWWLPLPLALSANLGYSVAGLFYEWAHYIVHTKVRFRGWGSRFWIQMRDNHMRHHRINSDYWYAFSMPWMDDLFHSNPNVQDVRRSNTRLNHTSVHEGPSQIKL
ncbi:fatty acid hydroxylase superfamily protein [Nitzschia inconspicua]|uniref:Fatty acid hydroxylase superfamily protein n=1 Tax=Nitzschia inconspicua TaxID=303405 RepID=A0A9K3KSF2_9STRA|nr:fatty acid hydroxylase superfamily protein [Nitzschia inconspicua]